MDPITVLGESVREDYDLVLPHEHVFLDLRSSLTHGAGGTEAHSCRVTNATAAAIRATNPFSYADNLVLDDIGLMCREMEVLSGRRVLIIDVTSDTLGRSPDCLAEFSRRTGVDVVMGCGAYVRSSWPPGLEDSSQDQLTEFILRQFEAEQRPSVIGEIGIGPVLDDGEVRSLRAAATAQRYLDVPLFVHVSPWNPLGHEALDLIEREGADLTRVVVCHVDGSLVGGPGYARSLLERGCVVAFDIWGNDALHGGRVLPADRARAMATAALTFAGFGDRILHSQDVCTKTQLTAFGGPGYGHVDSAGRRLLLDAGLNDEQIHRQLTRNALDLLRVSGR